MLTRDMKHDMFLDRESINLFRKEIVVEINFRAKFINLSRGGKNVDTISYPCYVLGTSMLGWV